MEQENQYENQIDYGRKQSNMSLASMIMGIIGLVISCCGGGVVCGSLGILFAFLSKIEGKFEKYAIVGFITSIIAFVISLIAIAILVVFRIKGGNY